MYKSLNLLNFGPNIVRWVITSFFSECFITGRGCRQGEPISPYLFNICVVIMGTMIRQNRNMRGIHIQRE